MCILYPVNFPECEHTCKCWWYCEKAPRYEADQGIEVDKELEIEMNGIIYRACESRSETDEVLKEEGLCWPCHNNASACEMGLVVQHQGGVPGHGEDYHYPPENDEETDYDPSWGTS